MTTQGFKVAPHTGSTLPEIVWHPCESHIYLPRASGLYRLSVVVGSAEYVLYIGQSRCIRARVSKHLTRRHRFRRIEAETGEPIRIHFMVAEDRDLLAYEAKAIRSEFPYMNKEYAEFIAKDVSGTTDYVIATIRAERRMLSALGSASDDFNLACETSRRFGREEKERLGVYASRGWGPGETPLATNSGGAK